MIFIITIVVFFMITVCANKIVKRMFFLSAHGAKYYAPPISFSGVTTRAQFCIFKCFLSTNSTICRLSQRRVIFSMIRPICNFKIFDPIVRFYTIFMVNDLFGFKFSSNKILHNKSVFKNFSFVNNSVAVPHANAAFPRRRIGTGVFTFFGIANFFTPLRRNLVAFFEQAFVVFRTHDNPYTTVIYGECQ